MPVPDPVFRYYPTACTSAYCSQTSCPRTCPSLPRLEDFRAWRRRTAAVQDDPTWAPTTWRATITTTPAAKDPRSC